MHGGGRRMHDALEQGVEAWRTEDGPPPVGSAAGDFLALLIAEVLGLAEEDARQHVEAQRDEPRPPALGALPPQTHDCDR